jgi:para-nitrobenzyl esterase
MKSGDDMTTRRQALQGAAAFIGGAAALTSTARGATDSYGGPNASRSASDTILAKDGEAVVATTSGKVAGYVHNGIFTFKGIPYGDTTAAVNRFMPPRKPKPWAGVRSARQYGYCSPQRARTGWANDEEAFLFTWDDGIPGEDCLRLNVWTPKINDARKRPVMVWLHGGGFTAGNGQEHRAYEGENLARRGDVVLVSVNHRLNVFGYLDLSAFGEQYAASGNVGMLDIVAALEWVRDNIAAFGGDPGCVTIFGQSGGGGKVGTLMAMPSAKGLFHRAIIQSGSMLRVGTQDNSRKLAGEIVRELGLDANSIDRIGGMPYQQVLDASSRVLDRLNTTLPGGVPNFRRLAEQLGFSPVVDGKVLPAQPFDPKPAPYADDVPLLVGSTLNEFVHAINHPEYENLTNAELEQRVQGMFGAKAPAVLKAFRTRTPDAKPFDLWSHIAASSVREAAIKQVRLKAAVGKAPAYLYWFTWQTPVLDGRPRAFHCAEIAFCFDNTDRAENMTGGGPRARKLAAVVSDAWLQFARTGDPNHPAMPNWKPVSANALPTMIFDDKLSAVDFPDRGEQESIA